MTQPSKILVIGGGAGGLELATKLGNSFGRTGRAVVTLIDASPIHLWKPLLHEAAAGTLLSNEDELNFQSFASNHHFKFCLGAMQGLNRAKKQITLAATFNEKKEEIIPERCLDYDVLIIAVGSTANDFGIPGVRDHCFFLDNRGQAIYFHQQFLENMLRLAYQTAQAKPQSFSIAIVGGGATGVELAAELRYAITLMIKSGLALNADDVSIHIIEAADRLLPALPKRISTLVSKKLAQLRIQILTGKPVVNVNKQGVTIGTDQMIGADMIVWSAGIKAPDFLCQLDGLEVNRINQLVVKPTLQTTRDDAIFALGDCASCSLPASDKPVPARAQAAHQQAIFMVKQLVKYFQQQPLSSFHYRDHGSLIALGQHETIGNLMTYLAKDFIIEGFLASWVYRSLYKMHQNALFGPWRVMLLSIANRLSRRVRPRVKLH